MFLLCFVLSMYFYFPLFSRPLCSVSSPILSVLSIIASSLFSHSAPILLVICSLCCLILCSFSSHPLICSSILSVFSVLSVFLCSICLPVFSSSSSVLQCSLFCLVFIPVPFIVSAYSPFIYLVLLTYIVVFILLMSYYS